MKGEMKFDNLIKKTVTEEGLEIPPAGFSEKVMHSINETSVRAVYKPLIPKYTLVAILGCIILSVIFFLVSGELSESAPRYLATVTKHFSKFHLEFSLSPSLSYSIWAAMIILVIQAVLIGKIHRKMFRQH